MTREEAIEVMKSWAWMQGETGKKDATVHWESTLDDVVEALHMAIAALREQPRWISVEERLPEPDTDVLARRSIGTDVECYHKEDGGYWRWDEHSGKWRVTHWMPLPEPPEVEV